MIVVFDLDDTLYNESNYVRSGFRAVANFASDVWGLDKVLVLDQLNQALAIHGRGQVFDVMLSQFELLSRRNIKRCLGVYRRHMPSIRLHSAGTRCLHRFQSWPIYLVTDGNKLVQSNKVKALDLQSRFRRVMITHRFGVHNAKPSPYCFEIIARSENVNPNQVVYVGDNPEKDFVGIKPLGFRTVRVLTGMHKDVRKPAQFDAEVTINTLDELTLAFIKDLQQ